MLFGGWAALSASCGVSLRIAQGKPPTASGWQAGRWLDVCANAVLACRCLQAEAAAKAKAKEDLKAFLLSNEVNKKVGGGGKGGDRSVGGGRVEGHRGCSLVQRTGPCCLPLPAAVEDHKFVHVNALPHHSSARRRSRRRRLRGSGCRTWSTCGSRRRSCGCWVARGDDQGWCGRLGSGGERGIPSKQAVQLRGTREGSSYLALALKLGADQSSSITFEVQHFLLLRPDAGTNRSGSGSSCWRR